MSSTATPIKSGRVKATGTVAELWRNEDIEAFPAEQGLNYVLRCVDHEFDFGTKGQREARDLYTHPERGWCEMCTTGEPSSDSDADDGFMGVDAPASVATQRVQQYGTLSKGDQVKVRGEHGVFTVMYVDEFEEVQRPAEVTVIGGASGRNAWRTFPVNVIKQQPKRRQTN
jgi:hypothetical protein